MKNLDALTLVLLAAAFGLAVLPPCWVLVTVLGGDGSALIAFAAAYGGAITIVAPIIGKRRRNGNGGSNGGGGGSGE